MKLVKPMWVAWVVCALPLAFAANAAAEPVPLSRTEATVSKSATSLPGPTYAWVAMPEVEDVQKDPRLQDPQLQARLKAALAKAMQAKGYRLADEPAEADFILAYGVGVEETQQATVQGDQGATPLNIVACDWSSCSQLVVMNDSKPNMKLVTTDRAEGGLMVEMIEPRTVRVLWRALNKGAVKQGDGSQKSLDNIAARTLARLPARSK
jgi:hypothetical protein